MKTTSLLGVILLFIVIQIQAQTTNISGVVNTYYSVSLIDPCDHNKLEISNATGLSVGDKVMIIQMQGLVINETNTSSFGTFNAAADTTTGFYEIAEIQSISGTSIAFTFDIINKYNPLKNVQLVKIPQYVDANVTGVLSPQAWDGSTGGVLAIEVSGTLTLNANISAQGKGFRGGKRLAPIANSCNFVTNITDYATDTLTWHYKSFKGEGVATYVPNKWASRGPQANGGGGGNDHNSGAGGGANRAAGGAGGRNLEPGTFNCKGNNPGLGGLSLLSLSGDRIFMGGGGGSGHENNNVNFPGGNGGGIVYIKAGVLVGNSRLITASGDSSLRGGQDGGGGGGAGGTIKLDVASFSGTLTISANGGKGATVDQGNSNRCFGPGGGGAGGIVCITASSMPGFVTLQANGGSPGVVYRSTNACNGSNNLATAGGTGTLSLACSAPPKSSKTISNCNPLPVAWLYMNVAQELNYSKINWATATEINNDYFEILRSNDGINYQVIGKVKGNGNTTQNSYYDFIDQHPINGVNYYQIKQVDKDKKYSYSTIEYVYYGLNWTLDDIAIYPNPVASNLEPLELIFPSTEHDIEILIYDLMGNLMLQEKVSKEDAYNGHHTIDFNKAVITNMAVLKMLSNTGEVFTKKIVQY